MASPTEIKSEEAFRVPRSKGRILSKNFFSSHGTVVTGEIEKLMIGTGNEVIIIGPTGLSIRDKISSIEIDKKQTNVAIAGEVVGVCLKNSSINDLAAI